MSAILIGGGLTHYESLGRGKPLLLLHGWVGSWRYWANTMDSFSAHYRTYALDFWGYGDSTTTRSNLNLSDYVAQVEAFMDEMGIGRTPLIGHALGAVVAVQLAGRHPDRITKLVLVNPPIVGECLTGAIKSMLNPMGDRLPIPLLSGGGGDSSSWLSRTWKVEHPEITREATRLNKELLAENMRTLIDLDLRPQLSSLSMPTLVIFGRKDRVVTPNQSNNVPNSNGMTRAIIMDDSYHFPMLDEANKFNRLVMEFLEGDVELKDLTIKEEWRRRMGLTQ